MKIAITGASGFIGRHALAQLAAAGDAEILAIGRNPDRCSPDNVRWISADLLTDDLRPLFRTERPTHLLHLAWNATPGVFWSTPENLDWVAASLKLQRAFQDAGGTRIVSAGTCAEYDWTGDGVLSPDDTPLQPATLYGIAKNALRQLSLASAAGEAREAAWGRVFWLYGPREKARRLVSDIAGKLAAGQEAECSAGLQRRDYLHVADVAAAFNAALRSHWCGVFNIGSGAATPVHEVAGLLAKAAGRPDLIRLGARPTPAGDPPCLVADIRVIRDEFGFVPHYTLEQGLTETYGWWREQL